MGLTLTFYGTRGSISSPGRELEEFGANTPCMTIQDDDDNQILLDAGFGLANFSDSIKKPKKAYHILLSHFHWDHIQGLGFFFPIFIPGNEIHFYSCYPIETMESALDMYFDGSYGPFNGFKSMPSKLNFHRLKKSQKIGGFEVKTIPLNHNDPCYGFRITGKEKSIVYAPNHEPSGKAPGKKINDNLIEFSKEADILIHDAYFTDNEFKVKKGWGHSGMTAAVRNGLRSKCKKILLFYHEPLRTDRLLTLMETEFQMKYGEKIEIEFARENKTFKA